MALVETFRETDQTFMVSVQTLEVFVQTLEDFVQNLFDFLEQAPTARFPSRGCGEHCISICRLLILLIVIRGINGMAVIGLL